ncbi:O-antigen translocase [Ferrigenium sp. UT5]|uniref:O-antigen translocase n=1 Tax=Ferrigenium sp. UT5 TaxID=3242105 RepID=UPI00354F493E
MTLIKTSLLNGIAVVIKMLTLLGLNKILAIYVGPAGYAILGQFLNAVQMITNFASGAINQGVTKYTAEYSKDSARQHTVWRTAAAIALTGSLLIAVFIAAFNQKLAGWFLKDESLGSVFIWFSTTLVLFVFNSLLQAILNGKREIRRYVIANIAGSLFAFAVTTWMAMQMGLYGALVALVIYQSLTFFVTLALIYNANWFRPSYLFGRIDRQVAKNLGKFTIMALTSAVTVPISHILIRNHLGETLGWDAAGYWEAAWRLSNFYLMLVTTTLSVYYLPKLSELQHSADIKREIIQGYKIILPVAAACSLAIYLNRDFLIRALFSTEFAPMEVLFAWQMVGDTLKIGSWILAYLMLGKAMIKLFVVSEILSSAMFYVLTVIFTQTMGLEGVALSHAVNYLIYWSAMAIFIPKVLRQRARPNTD